MKNLSLEHIKKRIASKVTYEVVVHPEDMPIEGNVCASGDADLDKSCEEEVMLDLERGNEWAWCTIEVRATWRGFSSSDFLGCCSYKSLNEFVECGHYDDMKVVVLDALCGDVLTELTGAMADLTGEDGSVE